MNMIFLYVFKTAGAYFRVFKFLTFRACLKIKCKKDYGHC